MRTKLFKKVLLVVGMTVVMCGYALQASAINFTFTEQAGFLVGGTSLVSEDVSSPYNDIQYYQNTTAAQYQVAPKSGEFNTIAWGVVNNSVQNAVTPLSSDPWDAPAPPTQPTWWNTYSALRVFGQTGTVVADGGWVVLTKLYHKNSTISSDFYSLTNTSINGILTISPANSGFPDDKTSDVKFLETTNTTGSCPDGSPAGTACPDYFIDVLSTFDSLYFTWNGRPYEVQFDLDPITFAAIDQPSDNEVRVWTQEGEISQVNVTMRILDIPEPASLLLLGLGLLGVGFARRRGIKK